MADVPVTVRFAPSPTGRLHVGNARQALINWLFARAHGGHFLLRLDDTDTERSTTEFAEGIETDLRWLGLEWDRFARQSERLDRYAAAVERLKADGRLYPCYETSEELALKRKSQLNAGRPPVYDRAALRLSEDEKAAKEAAGLLPHWRFKLIHETVAWEDLVRGASHQDMASQSDPVLLRADGRPIYTLASVVDDIELGVSHIIRGEDHVTNSAAQIQLFQALGAPPPVLGHLSLIVDAEGKGLSKRLGSLSLDSLRLGGIEPMAINSLLAGLGSNETVVATTLRELVDGFDIARYGRATPRFDPEDLKGVNAKILHATPYEAVADRLADLGVGGGEAFWLAVRGNLVKLIDAAEWWRVVSTPIAPVIAEGDRAFCAAAAEHLPEGVPTAETWGVWTGALKAESGRKGKGLFMPLRLALTGRERGPELGDLLPFLGRDRAIARLRGELD
ncbi:MAG: glutamate--tRNA ligase [Alphaproteobacteria bacterium]|nr:glutamate--tRNA ligase [Alphaproteobacteria bacterium]